ncbi:MAG TPA: hypothetical protein VEN30_07305, partial [Paraburkholderia sp.]|nr:hypothetical protein [Paraburkholderia sp.]
MSTVGGYAPTGATVQETSTTERGGAAQGRRHVSRIPRQYRTSLFRHAAGLAPHHRAANAAQLLHILHGSKTPSHMPAKHDERGHPHQHQQQKQKQQQQDQHAHQHRQRKPRPSSAPHHAQRGPHHPARTLRWQIAHAGRGMPNAPQDASGRWPDGRDGNREQQHAGAAKQRGRAVTRIPATGRTELQT